MGTKTIKRGNAKNAIFDKLKIDALMRQQQELAQRMMLTEAEKIQMTVLLQRAQELQAQFNQVNIGLSGLVAQIVTSRKLNPKIYGVNLAAGRILPLDQPQPGGDGESPEEVPTDKVI